MRLEIGLPWIFKDVQWNQSENTLTSTWMKDLLFFLGDNDILLHDYSHNYTNNDEMISF